MPRKINNKTVTRYLSDEEVADYEAFFDNAKRLRQGQAYNFEGFEIKGNSPMLKCHSIVTGKLTVRDTGTYAS